MRVRISSSRATESDGDQRRWTAVEGQWSAFASSTRDSHAAAQCVCADPFSRLSHLILLMGVFASQPEIPVRRSADALLLR